ncbi:hypothetical protein FZ934_20890 (plasmid) [Rhizobium grahamii]|uniref:Uncharacterized protein n=1 Tax=Rhizobium grahamii TaxID=1120045 RepID=A0A5Q0CBK9_9HYPH|nr:MULTISPECIES: hypothetical protein [Rhizobium]QFY62813.1 hypothetical protein FZ934_20890 [Rhizobium grahamii]QRM52440.1 hypothetical protein F3Y33_24765 [Rhizobium sp. BG6]
MTACILFAIGVQSQAADFMDSKCRDFRKSFSIDKRTIERPEPPFCATMFGQFDELSFNRCRSEMEDYRNKVAKFTDCLFDENERATEEFNTAVQNFNRRVGR